MPAKKAGTASSKSSQQISLKEEVIITPTATKARRRGRERNGADKDRQEGG